MASIILLQTEQIPQNDFLQKHYAVIHQIQNMCYSYTAFSWIFEQLDPYKVVYPSHEVVLNLHRILETMDASSAMISGYWSFNQLKLQRVGHHLVPISQCCSALISGSGAKNLVIRTVSIHDVHRSSIIRIN